MLKVKDLPLIIHKDAIIKTDIPRFIDNGLGKTDAARPDPNSSKIPRILGAGKNPILVRGHVKDTLLFVCKGWVGVRSSGKRASLRSKN